MFVGEMRAIGLLGPSARVPSVAARSVPTRSGICWLDLAYADLSIQHLTGPVAVRELQAQAGGPELIGRGSGEDRARRVRKDDAVGRRGVQDRVVLLVAGEIQGGAHDIPGAAGRVPVQLLSELSDGQPAESAGRQGGGASGSTGDRSLPIPRSPDRGLDLGLIMVNEGKFQDAVKELTAVLGLPAAEGMNDVRAVAHYGLAAAKGELGDLKEALAEVERSLALAPRSPDALALRARLAGRDAVTLPAEPAPPGCRSASGTRALHRDSGPPPLPQATRTPRPGDRYSPVPPCARSLRSSSTPSLWSGFSARTFMMRPRPARACPRAHTKGRGACRSRPARGEAAGKVNVSS